MPPTRREQIELDELLSDIYRGIETLPDKSKQQVFTNHYNIGKTSSSNNKYSPGESLTSRTYVREYELPASSPIVKQHKQDIAAFRNQQQRTTGDSLVTNSNSSATKQPQRSTLKRHTNTPDSQGTRQQPQSLASFVTSTTPENKRRVRIVDHPDKLQKSNNNYSSDEDYNENYNDYNDTELHQQRQTFSAANKKPPKVKYVNTNKLIYHDEKNPGDEIISDSDGEDNNSQGGGVNYNNNNNNNGDDDEDIDGVSRIEYYHTTWLDRQLGRASKRRSSKELNERQVKEKAMIEELKRSLKNGAITLRQSFKGKRNANSNKNKPSETYDDQMLDIGTNYSDNSHKRRVKEPSNTVFGSGLATLPRNYHNNNSNKQVSYNNNNNKSIVTNYKQDDKKRNNNYFKQPSSTPKQTLTSDNYFKQQQQQQPTTSNTYLFDSAYQPASQIQPQFLPTAQSQQQESSKTQYSSRTLPHNYQTRKGVEHQLLQSHYRGSEKPQGLNTLGSSKNSSAIEAKPVATSKFVNNNSNNSDKMRNLNYNSNTYNPGFKSPMNNQFDHHQQQQQQPVGETISSLPSANEVVRSALSRSSSQASVNQLNKTINLLPNSPPPYASSPMSPTQQLKAASPVSPSPDCRSPYQRQNSDLINNKNNTHQHFTSKTMGSPSRMHQQQQSPQHQPATLHGTRIVNKPEQKLPLQQHQNQQPAYANPHASLMQHRVEQQMRQPSRNNNASIREFNELDSLLRSLSPGSTTHITPGFTSKQSQPTVGYGFTAQPQPQPQSQPRANLHSDIYAKVQKQPVAQPTKTPSYLQQHYGNNPGSVNTTNQGYTIDVSKKPDDSCVQRQNLSEFEPPIELIPSMEDYQNITKLNPVKNQYWYKPNMSRDRAISLLKDKPQGTFIVRDSTSFKGAYGLAVKVAKLPKNVLNNANLRNPNGDPSSELIRHFLIEPTENGVRLKGYANESVYDSLPDLIYQHSLTEIALPCKLVIPRADIEDPSFNHRQKQFYDDFVASREIAKHNPYERTSPNGGYRRYPGDVYVHNEHRIIFE